MSSSDLPNAPTHAASAAEQRGAPHPTRRPPARPARARILENYALRPAPLPASVSPARLRPARRLPLLLAAGAALALSACTGLAPLHSSPTVGASVTGPAPLAYAAPASRIEQIVYQHLRLTLGEDSAGPLATLAIARADAPQAMSQTANPATLRQLTLTGTLTIAPRTGFATPVTLTRTASAGYTTSTQALAAQDALFDAESRAARALADSLRLALLAALAP